jgi:hypothetical protein
MTELKDVDSVLRDSFARIAEPGDPAGVVDSIRTRMDAGDTGTPANSSGFGAGLSPLSWLPWGAMVVVAGLVGAGLGLSGVVGAPAAEVVQLTVLAVDATTDAYDCPGGAAVSTFSANERALVVARTEDSEWLGVRDSYDYSRTVWLPASVVSVDAGQGDVDAVPVQDCVVPEVVINTPIPVPVETVEPEKPVPPAVDTTAPSLKKPTVSAPRANNGVCPGFGEQATISVVATDNVGVTGVAISWSGAKTGSGQMSGSGSSWSFVYAPANETGYGLVNFVLVARDAAGNLSAPQSASVLLLDCPS